MSATLVKPAYLAVERDGTVFPLGRRGAGGDRRRCCSRTRTRPWISTGTPTLDGLGAVGGGAHADNEHVLAGALPGRAALLAALIDELLAEEAA